MERSQQKTQKYKGSWRGGACHGSRVMVGESRLNTFCSVLWSLLSVKNMGGERKLRKTHKDDSLGAKEHWRRNGKLREPLSPSGTLSLAQKSWVGTGALSETPIRQLLSFQNMGSLVDLWGQGQGGRVRTTFPRPKAGLESQEKSSATQNVVCRM